jgi:hypothetical protein
MTRSISVMETFSFPLYLWRRTKKVRQRKVIWSKLFHHITTELPNMHLKESHYQFIRQLNKNLLKNQIFGV